MNNFITIATFEYPHEVAIIKSKLEFEGIKVFLKDELTIQTDNFLSNAIGGVKLQVLEKDINKAKEILKLFNVNVYQNNYKPQKFVLVFDSLTKKIPLLNKLSLPNRGMFIIGFFIIVPIILSIFLSSHKHNNDEVLNQINKDNFNYYLLPKIDTLTEVNPKDAIKTIDLYLKEYPNKKGLVYNKGLAYFKLDSFIKSKKMFLKVYDGSSNEAYNIALCDMKLHNYKSAIKYFKIASKINLSVKYNLAEAYEKNNEYKKALQYYNEFFDKIIAIEKLNMSKSTDIYFNLVKVKDSIITSIKQKIKNN